MKIKHWQGYGSLDITKLAAYPVNSFKNKIIIQVKGNHECGIVKRDVYDVWNWLLKRGERFNVFPDSCKDYRQISELVVHGPYYDDNNIETAVYEITYHK